MASVEQSPLEKQPRPKKRGRRTKPAQAQQRYSRRSVMMGLAVTGVAVTTGIAVHSLTTGNGERSLIVGGLKLPDAEGQAITYPISPAIIKEKTPSLLTPPDRNSLKDLILELQENKVTDPKELRRGLVDSLGLVRITNDLASDTGNCFRISPYFYLTAGHIFARATSETSAKITMPGTGDRLTVTHYINGFPNNDLVILYAPDQNPAQPNQISLATQSPEPGQHLFQIGLNTQSNYLHTFRGKVASEEKTTELARVLGFPNAIAVEGMISLPGLSGSPVIYESGTITGLQSNIYKLPKDARHGGAMISPVSRLLAVAENQEISPLSTSNHR